MVTKADLITMFKLKLLQPNQQHIDDLFGVPEVIHHKPYLPLFNFFILAPIVGLDEKLTLLNTYVLFHALKIKQLRSHVALSKFVTARYTFKDFRLRIAPIVDFKVVTDIMKMEIVGPGILDRMKLNASLMVSVSNFVNFIRPALFLTYFNRKIPWYTRLFNIQLKKALFKRLTHSFYLFIRNYAWPLMIPYTVRVFTKFFKKAGKLSPFLPQLVNYFTTHSLSHCIIFCFSARDSFYEVFNETGLVTFNPTQRRKNKGQLWLAKHSEVAHFAHYYPFNLFERGSAFRHGQTDLSTKISWLPRRLLENTEPERINTGFLLSNFFRPTYYSNISLLKVGYSAYPKFFKNSLQIYDHQLYKVFIHKTLFNRP